MSGFFALRREAFERAAPQLSPKGFKIMLELLYVLTNSPEPCRVVEHGITFGLREHGKSKLSAKVMLDYVGMLCAAPPQQARISARRFRRTAAVVPTPSG